MTNAADWTGRVGDAWAAEWRRTDRSFATLAPYLDAAILAAAPRGPFEALDIGCGAGATSLALAAARPDAQVIGVDLSAELIAVARERAAGRANARFERDDVLSAAAAIRPDLLVSRHGVMFFPDPVIAFTCLHETAAPGAEFVFSCFAERSGNRFATLADEIVGTVPVDGSSPGPFAFADQARVWSLLERAGWQPAAAARVEFAYRAGEGVDPVADAVSFLSRIGPVSTALRDAPDRDTFLLSLAERLASYRRGDVVDLPAVAWIWRASA